jgi:phospholipase C
LRSWSYGVKAGDTIADMWPVHEFEEQHYHLRVYGPNGFYREFKGNQADPAIETGFEYQRNMLIKKLLTGNIALKISNTGHKPHTVTLIDNSYKSGTRKKVLTASGTSTSESTFIVDLAKNHGWYDFSIKVDGINGFEKRYAGRIETGKPSYSDPLMGRVIV